MKYSTESVVVATIEPLWLMNPCRLVWSDEEIDGVELNWMLGLVDVEMRANVDVSRAGNVSSLVSNPLGDTCTRASTMMPRPRENSRDTPPPKTPTGRAGARCALTI